MYKVGTVARLKGVALGVLVRAGLMILIPFMSVGAGSVNVVWDPSPDAGVAGYNVYYGTASHNYPNEISVGTNLTDTLSDLADGKTYFISVTALDAAGIESDFSNEITYSVPGANNPPTISAISSQSVLMSHVTAAIAFTVSDPETAASSLTVSAVSSDTTLVPNGNIVLSGTGQNRSVKITPGTGLTGNAQITVSVSDGVNTTSTAFTLTVQTAPPNNPPTISSVANQTINVNAATAALSFTIGDAESSASSLTVSAISSNTGLVPNGNITLGGSGANRTVKVTPAAGQAGSAQITVSVSDGVNTTSTTFIVTVQNTAPTISSIANQAVTENKATGTIPFTIGDAQSSASSLTVSAVSSNTGLVPNGNIVLGGSGANRTVKVTPAAGQAGSAQITVSVSDGVLATSTTFTVTVQAVVNNAPTISGIGNQVVNENQATAAISFTIGDTETSPSSLTLSTASSNTTLVPKVNIALGGSGASRTVKVTPVTGKTGSAQITISVSDGTNTTSSSFTLTVQPPVNTPPTISAVADQTINENQTTAAIAFTIGDAETAAASLTLSAASSDTALVPTANVAFAGTGASRTVRVAPAAGQSGSAQITLSVSDGVNVTSTSFTLTVQQTAGNTPPTISIIPDQIGYMGNPTTAIPFTVGDAESPAASLTLSAVSVNTTLVPNGNIVFGGTGANRTVTITPAAGQIGSTAITIVVSDGGATAQTTFNLDVQQATAMAKTSLPKSSSYNGLFYEDSTVRVQSAGAFKLTVTSAGKYSGSVQMADGTHAFTGSFGTLCQGSNVILRKGATPLLLSFSLMGDNATNQFVGNLSDGVWGAPMHGSKAIFNIKTNPAPYVGNYTVAIPGQGDISFSLGNGFGSVKVDGNGNVKLAGVLADGTKISQSAPLSKDGTWPMFVPLYKGKGLAIAWISFTNRTADDLHGQVNWIKQPDVTAHYYPEGLAVAGNAVGSTFAPPSILALNLQVAALQSAGVGNGRITSLKVSASTGTFTGSLLNGTTGAPVNFQGALLQKPNAGYGFFLGTNESMPVVLSP